MPEEVETAPKQCEMCDTKLPTWADREYHMEETGHCRCWKCGDYIPPGGTYAHLSNAHGNDPWNEHMAAWSDKKDLEEAKPWVRGEEEKPETQETPQTKSTEEKKEENPKEWVEGLFREVEERALVNATEKTNAPDDK
jgi:hypothetical protein